VQDERRYRSTDGFTIVVLTLGPLEPAMASGAVSAPALATILR